jgi:hypothetical protein
MVAALIGVSGGGVPAVAASAPNAWSVVPTPSRPAPVAGPFYNSVACPTATSCVTVGRYNDGVNELPLVGHSSRGTWSIESSTVPQGGKFSLGGLSGVACLNRTSCFAVGDYDTGTSTAEIGRAHV